MQADKDFLNKEEIKAQEAKDWYNSLLDSLHQVRCGGDRQGYLLELLTGVGGVTMEIKEKAEDTETVELNPKRLSFVSLGTKISICISDDWQTEVEENERFMRLLDLKPFVHAQLALALNLKIEDYFSHRCYSPEYLAEQLTKVIKMAEGFVKIEWDRANIHSMEFVLEGRRIA